jgi:uncharacterized protein (TIGR03382 family)
MITSIAILIVLAVLVLAIAGARRRGTPGEE